MGGALQIARIKGIPVRAHWSLLFALPWLAFYFAQHFVTAAAQADIPAATLGSPWPWAVGLAIALFASILLHELAHALYAKRKGVRVADITLLIFGGISRVDPMRAPRQEAVMAGLGPLTSLALSAAAFLAWSALDAASFKVRFALFCFGHVNLLLGIFNLLPAFPMDGGRVLRALLSARHGHARATRIAATVGKGFALAFGVLGFISFNFLLILIAFFIYLGAQQEGAEEELKELLAGARVRDLMSSDAGSVDAGMPLDAAAEVMLAQRRPSLAVADAGSVLGVLMLDDVRRVPRDKRHGTTAGSVARKAPAVGPDEDAALAVDVMNEHQVTELPVVDGTVLIGTFGMADVARGIKLLELRREAHDERKWAPA